MVTPNLTLTLTIFRGPNCVKKYVNLVNRGDKKYCENFIVSKGSLKLQTDSKVMPK